MKERVRSVLECEGEKKIKERVCGGGVEIGWTRVWRRKTRKKKKKKRNENKWMRMN